MLSIGITAWATKGSLFKMNPQPIPLLRQAYYEHQPVYILILWSGGGDSTAVTDITFAWIKQDNISTPVKVVSIETFLGHDHWRDYITHHANGFDHQFYSNPNPDWYAQKCLEGGFPYNPRAQHPMLYQRLKERAIYAALRDHKGNNRFNRVLFVSGIRKFESKRQQALQNPITRMGSAVFVNPLFYWRDQTKTVYLIERELPTNPFKAETGGSGDCYCIGLYCPASKLRETGATHLADRLESLEKQVKPIHGWGYSEKPDPIQLEQKKGQLVIPGVELQTPFLCATCHRAKPGQETAVTDWWGDRLFDDTEVATHQLSIFDD